MIDIVKPLIIVADPGMEAEAVLRLARVGFENVKGFLSGGIPAWEKSGNPIQTLQSVSAEEFASAANDKRASILDVRRPSEYQRGHIPGAKNIELAELNNNISVLDKDKTYHVHCAGGYRSMIACSILKAEGFKSVFNISGGYEKIKDVKITQSKII